jgi:hypothetical protein
MNSNEDKIYMKDVAFVERYDFIVQLFTFEVILMLR